jgi:CHAT domain-containing protein/tetratricopeptide (TPR) repeat protein
MSAIVVLCSELGNSGSGFAQDQSLSADQRKQLASQAVTLSRRFREAYKKGDYRNGLIVEKEVLEISRKSFGEENELTAFYYYDVGTVSAQLKDYAAARKYHERALAIRRRVLGEEHVDTATSFNALGIVCDELGDFSAGRMNFEHALKIKQKRAGEDDSDTARTYNNLGLACNELGDYAMARRHHQQALTILRKVLGDEHPDTATAWNSLGMVSDSLGDYSAARMYYERALTIRRKVLGEENFQTAESYNNLGILAGHNGDYNAAVTYHQQAAKIKLKVLGKHDISTAISFNNLGVAYNSLRDYRAARTYFERALAIDRDVLGEDHPLTGHFYGNLGNVWDDLGDYATARSYCERALAIQRRVLGEEHVDTAKSYNNLMVLDAEHGDWTAAAGWMDRQRHSARRQVAKILPGLSETEQRQFLRTNDTMHLELSLSLGVLRRQDRAIRDQSAAWLLNAKGVGQQALAERALLAREARDSKLAPVVKELTDVRRRLAQLSLAAPRPGQTEARQKQLAELSSQESDLSRQLVEAGGTTQVGEPWVEVDSVRSALPAGSALVDIARFRVYPLDEKDKQKKKWQPARYVAWVIPPSAKGDVQLVDLGEADPIDAHVKALRDELQAAQGKDSTLLKEGEPKAEAELRASFRQLANLIWKPLAPHVADAKQLYLSPDGALWLVPWGAIPLEKNKFLIEKLTINYVISGRDVIPSSQGTVSDVRKPVVFADPNFDLAPDDVTTAAKAVLRTTYQDEEAGQRTNDRSLLPRVGRLPGTAVEAEAVKPNVEKLTGKAPIVYRDIYALESVAKALNRPKVAIFSTHGFFLPDQEAKSDEKSSQLALAGEEHRGVTLTKEGKPFENPLLRCGLLFAGCNPRNEGQPGSGDDGVLTGMEIVGIDFRGTDLVVLSACETGVGTVNNGEGVAGLRQAFQLAGADAVVATLWQIPDADSARLMNDFFANLAAGQAKGAALRNAQLKRIESRRERFGAAHPYFWAAYTITGR